MFRLKKNGFILSSVLVIISCIYILYFNLEIIAMNSKLYRPYGKFIGLQLRVIEEVKNFNKIVKNIKLEKIESFIGDINFGKYDSSEFKFKVLGKYNSYYADINNYKLYKVEIKDKRNNEYFTSILRISNSNEIDLISENY